MNQFRLACIQLSSTDDPEANIRTGATLIRAAKAAGADLVATPENTDLICARSDIKVAQAAEEARHRTVAAYRDLAAELGIWLLLGSAGVKLEGEPRIANRSYLIRPDGGLAARYDKIHMFDVDLASGESYRESRNFRPGETARLAELPWGLLGMTICYDLRFPHLYRALAQAGATLLAVPSAFTRPTGAAHWHVLLRARAIENGCFVFAPAQCGSHAGDRRTYGHSLIVDPWGEVLADGGEDPGFIVADIDPGKVAAARRQVPSLDHDRGFSPPVAEVRAAE